MLVRTDTQPGDAHAPSGSVCVQPFSAKGLDLTRLALALAGGGIQCLTGDVAQPFQEV